MSQPPLTGAASWFAQDYRPAGFGYQAHSCIVTMSGCYLGPFLDPVDVIGDQAVSLLVHSGRGLR